MPHLSGLLILLVHVLRSITAFRRALAYLGVVLIAPFVGSSPLKAAEWPSRDTIAAGLDRLRETGTVLYVAAHPDDENTQLITYLARGRGYRTAYLSLTRGDGGQNVLAADFGERLGVARTQELLAARRLDGGVQFFTRALDFGFSKDFQETLSVWDRQQVLADVVRIIRQFRPDVIITRFPTRAGGTHGHHTSSAILAVEAFKLAGDPSAFPEQLDTLTPWQPKRVFWNVFRGGTKDVEPLKITVSGEDSALGISFSELAARSRAQHKTQGFDTFAFPSGTGPRIENFELLAGEPAASDIMDGVPAGWSRFPGGEAITAQIDALRARLSADSAAHAAVELVPGLLAVRKSIAALPSEALTADKLGQVNELIQACLGLNVLTTIPEAEVVPGEELTLTHTVEAAPAHNLRWVGLRYPTTGREIHVDRAVTAERLVHEASEILPATTPLTQPYWLREEPTAGMARVADPALIGRPENPPVFPVDYHFEISGERLVVHSEPLAEATAGGPVEKQRRLAVIAPVSLRFTSAVELFDPGATREIEVEIAAARPALKGMVKVTAPDGWSVSDAQPVELHSAGDTKRLSFKVTAPQTPSTARMAASVRLGSKEYSVQRVEVRYPHLPLQVLQPKTQMKTVSLELARRGERVAYIPGAGDTLAEHLRQIGYEVTVINPSDLSARALEGHDALVLGVRALNTRVELTGKMPVIFGFAEQGGNVILQYNNPNGLKVDRIAPFDLKISSGRVTDENSPVTLLVPEHPVLNGPNRLSEADFTGWVQERGLYFPGSWGPEFTPVLQTSDANEAPLKGALLVAKHGRGHFVYTGISFFRQLPAGVPGAYRLFANIVSLGK